MYAQKIVPYEIHNHLNTLDSHYPNIGMGKPLAEELALQGLKPIHIFVNAPFLYSDKFVNINESTSKNKMNTSISSAQKAKYFLSGLKMALKLIKDVKPDVVWIFFPRHMPPSLIRMIKRNTKMVVAFLASTEPRKGWLENYDLLLTSHPKFLEKWQKIYQDTTVCLLKPAFQTKFASRIPLKARKHPFIFAGKLSGDHIRRIKLLEKISRNYEIEIFADADDGTNISENFRNILRKPKWGDDYFNLLGESSLILNVHGEIAENLSSNIRMVEAPGAGGLLLTEDSPNLNEYFEKLPIPTFQDERDIQGKIDTILRDLESYQEIATKSQNWIIQNHSFEVRAKEVLKILSTQLR